VHEVPYTGDLDLSLVSTRSDLAAALRTVHTRADKPSLRALEARTRHSDTPLSKTVVAEMLRGVRFPRKAAMVAFLGACGLEDDVMGAWRRAWDRIAAEEEAAAVKFSEPGRAAVRLASNAQIPPGTADEAYGAMPPQEADGLRAAAKRAAAPVAEIEQLRERITWLSRDNQALRAQLGTSPSQARASATEQAVSDDAVDNRQSRSPVILRRELGALLHDLRLERQMTVAEIADHLMCSPAKIRHMESDFRAGTVRDVRDLCAFYALTSEESDHLLDLARHSKDRTWWQSFDLPYSNYVGLEAAAASIKSYQTSVVPGLLQNADYGRALARSALPRPSPEKEVQTVEARLIRQRLLTGPNPPRTSFILDEGALHRVIGGPLVMSAQLQKLTEAADLPDVSIQVIPYQAGAHAALEGNFTLLELASHAESIVFIEGLFGFLYIEKSDDVKRFKETFEHLRQVALSQERSVLLIHQIFKEMKNSIV